MSRGSVWPPKTHPCFDFLGWGCSSYICFTAAWALFSTSNGNLSSVCGTHLSDSSLLHAPLMSLSRKAPHFWLDTEEVPRRHWQKKPVAWAMKCPEPSSLGGPVLSSRLTWGGWHNVSLIALNLAQGFNSSRDCEAPQEHEPWHMCSCLAFSPHPLAQSQIYSRYSVQKPFFKKHYYGLER